MFGVWSESAAVAAPSSWATSDMTLDGAWEGGSLESCTYTVQILIQSLHMCSLFSIPLPPTPCLHSLICKESSTRIYLWTWISPGHQKLPHLVLAILVYVHATIV